MRHRGVRQLISALLFVAFGVVLFQGIQEVLIPKWRLNYASNADGQTREGETDKYGQFYSLPEDTVDYLVLGSSRSYFSIYPMQIYANTGITGYDLGNGGQQYRTSYHLLKEAIKSQAPSVLLLELSPLLKGDVYIGMVNAERDENYDYLRLIQVLTSMKPSLNKLQMILETEEENADLFKEMVFPFSIFHERWSDITADDFILGNDPDYVVQGSFPVFTSGNYSAKEERDSGHVFYESEEDNNEVSVTVSKAGLSEINVVYFEKILDLCEEHDIKLIPIICPSKSWTQEKKDVVADFLSSFGLTADDMTSTDLVQIDWYKDTLDSGVHLSYWGGAKVSRYVSDLLRDHISSDHRGQYGYEYWDAKLMQYQDWEQEKLLQFELGSSEAYNYLNRLIQVKDDHLIVITVRDEASLGWNPTLESMMQRLGVKSSFFDQVQNSFVCILDRGENRFEQWDERMMITFNGSYLSDDGKEHALSASSAGCMCGDVSSVNIDKKEYSVGKRGVNIVVIDRAGGVISSVCIDSHDPELTFTEKTLPEAQAEKWDRSIETCQLVDNGVYNIVPVINSACVVDVPFGTAYEDANIWLCGRNGLPPQEFELSYVGDGLYTIRAVCSDKYLAIEDMGSTSGSNVVQQSYTGLANQKWFITENESGSYSFTSLHNGCVLDVPGGIADSGANIWVCEENYLPPQQFYLEEIHIND